MRRIAACLTERPLNASGYRVSSDPHTISFLPLRHLVPLASTKTGRRVQLFVTEDYVVQSLETGRSAFEVLRAGYRHQIHEPDGRELLAFHWHPYSMSNARSPHLHLSSRIPSFELGANANQVNLADMHIPTGVVTLADVVRLLITEFGVEPRRPDWESILNKEMTSASDPLFRSASET